MKTRTALVIPCYNEADRLPVRQFLDFCRKHPDVRFWLVDDGSRDGTAKVLEGLKQQQPGSFEVLALEKNSGKAEAVRQGLLKAMEAGAEFAGFWDADLATPLEIVPSFIERLERTPQLEIVLGSRVKLLGYDVKRKPLRHYLGRIFATFASAVLDLPVYDTQCGAKLFRVTPDVKTVFQEPFRSRWIFDVEMLARFLRQKRGACPDGDVEAWIAELPLPKWHDVAGSKVKSGDFIQAAAELWTIFRTYR